MTELQMAQANDIRVRFYSDELCVLSRTNGARRAVEGPLASLLYSLYQNFGLRSVLQFVHFRSLGSTDTDLAGQHLSELLNEFLSREPTPLEKMLGDAPQLLEYAMIKRIPLRGMCEITYRCNLRCDHCYILHKIEEKHPSHVPEEAVLNTLQSMVNMGCLDVTLTGGEPTLHKGWLSFIEAAKSLHLYIVLKTNGTTFTKSRAKAYSQEPAHETHLSLYGACAETHDAFTHWAFDKIRRQNSGNGRFYQRYGLRKRTKERINLGFETKLVSAQTAD